jgi:hypothetical protein
MHGDALTSKMLMVILIVQLLPSTNETTLNPCDPKLPDWFTLMHYERAACMASDSKSADHVGIVSEFLSRR